MNDSTHPCDYHYKVAPPDYWCEVCQAHRKPMTAESSPTPKPPAAVRLARVARPGLDWELIGTNTVSEIHKPGQPTPRGGLLRHFSARRLDDLALVERRVCEAGPLEMISLWSALCKECDPKGGTPPEMAAALMCFAAAPQRAAALLAFLDAHPAVEERLAAGE